MKVTRALAVLAAAGAMLAVWHGTRPWAARRALLAYSQADRATIGGHFVFGYRGLSTARELVRAGYVGGIFLTGRNVAGRTAGQIAAEVAGLQAIRREAGWPPLIVATEQEGGPPAVAVTRISPCRAGLAPASDPRCTRQGRGV